VVIRSIQNAKCKMQNDGRRGAECEIGRVDVASLAFCILHFALIKPPPLLC
jgi:hypothetical protein